MKKIQLKKVAVIGVGLIGGSFSKDLKKYNLTKEIVGVEWNTVHAQEALQLGVVDSITTMSQACENAELIVLATPVQYIAELLPQVLDIINPEQVVMDVGSTKEKIVQSVEGHPNRKQFVAAHPMAGTEYSGPQAAMNDLFRGRYLVICNRESSLPLATKLVEDIWKSLDMKIVYHEASEHDMHCAYISHISHISSMALALTVLEKEKNEKRIFELAGGGFTSTVRLANSSAHTWIPIFEVNKDNILEVLDEYIHTISTLRSLMANGDFETFHSYINDANKIHKIVK